MNMQSTPTDLSFWQWVQSMPHPETIIMPIFFVTLTAIVVSGIVINSIHRRRAETELKRELLERGMGADEIVKVIQARPSCGWSRMHSRHSTEV
jgi:Na+/H+ antiporter NhaC